MNAANVADELCRFLSSEVLQGEASVEVDAELTALGVDSFSLMELVLFVERRFGVVLPMERLTPETTRTVRALSACVVGVGLGA